MTNRTPPAETDADVEALLQAVGRRDIPPSDMQERVYAATLAAFDSYTPPASEPVRRRAASSLVPWALAATVVLAWFSSSFVEQPADDLAPFGQIAHRVGDVTSEGLVNGGVAVGSTFATGDDSFANVRMQDGVDLRLGQNSSVRFVDAQQLVLLSGKVYVDTDSRGSLTVETPFARIHDIGTQFEVDVSSAGVAVAVREGTVDLRTLSGSPTARGTAQDGWGEVLILAANGELERERVGTQDVRWAWTQEAAPAFELDGATAHEFLTWATREVGVTLEYTGERVRFNAQQKTMRGKPLPGITLESAIYLLVEITDFQAELQGHRLVVDFKRDI